MGWEQIEASLAVIEEHDTVPAQSDIKIIDRPKTQRERYNVRDVPSGSWPADRCREGAAAGRLSLLCAIN